MGRIANTITMLELLANGRKYSLSELASKLEVSPRMIRFYKEQLDQAGIYIDSIRGPYGGYVLKQTIRIPNRQFDFNDYQLLQEINHEIKNDKLAILADKIKGIYLNQVEPKVLSEEDNKKYNYLSKAIKEKQKLKIRYYSFNKGDNTRIIRPLEMYLFGNGWNCAAFCENKKDLRNFELNRIKKIEFINENFK